MPKSKVLLNLLLEDDEEEQIDRNSEHDGKEHHVDNRSDTEIISEEEHHEHASSLYDTAKDNHVGYETRLTGLALGDRDDKCNKDKETEHRQGNPLVRPGHASCLVVVKCVWSDANLLFKGASISARDQLVSKSALQTWDHTGAWVCLCIAFILIAVLFRAGFNALVSVQVRQV